MILAVVLWFASLVVGLGAVYSVVVLIVRSVVPRDRRHEVRSALARPARGATRGLAQKARGGEEDQPEE